MVNAREVIENFVSSLNGRLIEDPSTVKLREKAKSYSVPNEDSILLFHTKIKARQPKANIIEGLDPKERVEEGVERVREALRKHRSRDFYVINRKIGTGGISFNIRAYIPVEFPHLALMTQLNFFHPEEDTEPDFVTLTLPDADDLLIFVDYDDGANVLLGTDYYGEHKMSFLRLAMNYSRDYFNSIGLHASSKYYRLKSREGFVEKGVLIFGLSGTGKSTLTMTDHGLKEPEEATVRQDDIVILRSDGHAYGTERNFYPKTDSLPHIPSLIPAVMNPLSVLENVTVKNGHIDFEDLTVSPNARAIAIREYVRNAENRIDLDNVNILFFLTRNPLMPAALRTSSPEQAVAYFMLGESVRTSAEAGKPEPVRVPGFDPFMLEPKWKTAMRLYEFLEKHRDVEAILLNTGYVGNVKVTPEETSQIILEVVREEIQWKYDEPLRAYVPVKVPGMDIERLDPYRIIGETYINRLEELRKDRVAFLESTLPQLKFLADYI
jgi:phosphoenolpyruvate carboxykinase (ATP)